LWRCGGTLVVSVFTCPSPVVGADVATKASRAVVPGSGGRSGRDRRPYASPRGGAVAGRDLTAADRGGGAARPEHDRAAAFLTPAVDFVSWEFRFCGVCRGGGMELAGAGQPCGASSSTCPNDACLAVVLVAGEDFLYCYQACPTVVVGHCWWPDVQRRVRVARVGASEAISP
jgi:hypothetical protein